MTTPELISTYQLNFFNSIEEIGNTPKVIDKRLTTCNDFLTSYLYQWERANLIDSELLPDLQILLSEEIDKFDDSTPITMIIASNTETKIYPDDSSIPDIIIPTQDFYDIIVLWRDFLNEPPLNGTLVDSAPSV